MANGLCSAVYPCDAQGQYQPAIPVSDPRARGIYFHIDVSASVPPPDQLQLKSRIERVLHVVDLLFPTAGAANEQRFRPYYVQLFELAALGLVGTNARPEIAAPAVESIVNVLIESEGGRVKNHHLTSLARSAFVLSMICIAVYVPLCFSHEFPWLESFLAAIALNPTTLSCFMMIWVGCFTGVVLSYGARTTTMGLDDLIIADRDLMVPLMRLLFSGCLVMILGIALALDIAEFKVGPIASVNLMHEPMMAFLFGALCGVSELALPGAVTKKAADVMRLTN